TYVIIELGHASFLFRPTILGITHGLILRGEMRDDVHARRIKPDEERLAVGLSLVHELECQIANLVVYRLHALRIERAGVLDSLLTDLAPARHLRGIILVGSPAMNHVARADDI